MKALEWKRLPASAQELSGQEGRAVFWGGEEEAAIPSNRERWRLAGIRFGSGGRRQSFERVSAQDAAQEEERRSARGGEEKKRRTASASAQELPGALEPRRVGASRNVASETARARLPEPLHLLPGVPRSRRGRGVDADPGGGSGEAVSSGARSSRRGEGGSLGGNLRVLRAHNLLAAAREFGEDFMSWKIGERRNGRCPPRS